MPGVVKGMLAKGGEIVICQGMWEDYLPRVFEGFCVGISGGRNMCQGWWNGSVPEKLEGFSA